MSTVCQWDIYVVIVNKICDLVHDNVTQRQQQHEVMREAIKRTHSCYKKEVFIYENDRYPEYFFDKS